MWYVYILQCSDDSSYIGYSDDVTKRIETHNAAKAARWTAGRLPVKIVYQEPFTTEQQAVKRERQIKRWSHAKKEALIAGDRKALKDLSKLK